MFEEGIEYGGNEEEQEEGAVQDEEVETNEQGDQEQLNTDGEFGEEINETTVQNISQEIHSLQPREQEKTIAEHPSKTTLFE